MLVSVVLPTYNRAHILVRAIDSVLEQTYTNWELIIIDNHSTDGTDDLVNSYHNPRIQLLKIHNDGIIAKSRNVGIRQAKGELIAFLDSDDIWESNKLEIQLLKMSESGCKFSSTAISLIDKKGKTVKKKYRNKLTTHLFNVPNSRNLYYSNQIVLSSVMIEKDFLGDLRFDEDEHMVAVEDYGLWLLLLRKKENPYIFIKENLVKYRVLDRSASSNWKRQQIRQLYCIIKHILTVRDYSLYKNLIGVFAYNILKYLSTLLFGWRFKG